MKKIIEKQVNRIFHHNNEHLPSFLLHSLFHNGKYLPYTSSSLKMKHLSAIINNICLHNRENILELGSGISTILIARLFKLNSLKSKIISIDESKEWQGIIKKYLEEEGLLQFVDLVTAPIVKNEILEKAFGYDPRIVLKSIENQKFDLILIDGPSAWNDKNCMSRATNFEFIENVINDNCTIFIDNADRKGELKLIQEISYKLNMKPTKIDSSFIAFKKGVHFNFVI